MNVPGGSMVTMNNTAQGGPVGSAPMINQAAARQQQDQESERRLNTYIFDYLCRSHHYDLARSFSQHCPINGVSVKPKANGVDDSMDADSKDDAKRPDNLAYPNIPHHPSENAFLYDWWCQFWDIFGAARNRGGAPNTEQYLHHNMNQTKLRQMQQQQMLNQTGGNNLLQMQQYRMNMPPNGMNNMQKQALQNTRPGAPNAAMMQQKIMAQNNMQRDGSMGDNRPQSPNAMGGNAPSPSKRPRTDDGGFNPGPAGRGGPLHGGQLGNMAGGPNGTPLLLQNGMPSEISQQQMTFPQNPNGQQKSLEAMGANGAAQGPMGQNNMDFPGMDRGQLPNGGAGGSQGNHALQDYQMQLMLLEQQNKKRLLMARQEQDNINHVPGSTPGGQGGPFAQNMSPSGSRAGPSPNPNDQMRKIAGTPKMNQNVPGSPAMPGDMQNRGTPPGNGYHEIPGVLRQQMFNANNPAMMGQPPSSHPGFNIQMAGQMNPQNMEQMRMANGARMPNGQQWTANGQQMMPQGQGPQGQGTPQQRNMAMPPPPAPNNQEQQRTQPSSPAPIPAPPTPQQTAKANPKGKKEGATKKQPQKAATKKGAAASTPAESNDPPATPTPSTPITPMHQQSFNQNGKTNGQPPQPAAQPSQPANHMDTFSTDIGQDSNNFALDFAVDGPDVLENFDFDSFLHNTDDNSGFGNFDLMTFDSNLGETPAGS